MRHYNADGDSVRRTFHTDLRMFAANICHFGTSGFLFC